MSYANKDETLYYDDKIVVKFLMATMVFGAIALLAGLIIALQMAFPAMNLGLEWTTFGRLRPLHTNAAIFAFAGNAIFAGIYHSSQRLLKTRMFSDLLSNIHFWGWQLIILSAAITLPLGITTGKEYAELEWPIDIAITVIWVIFAVNFFGTLAKRKEKHLYVALWFYIATIVTIAVLHIVNSVEIPVSFFKSYPVWGGVQDAMIQWWYGHNAVAFFLTTPFLGLMYYYIPKASGRPVYSYRLSIVHFWALVFLYIWAGPHHLLNTATPDWAQTLGMIFSLMLWAPSWGGMINGLLTLRGAWDLLRTEPVIKFFVAAITFYGMATFEGPLLSIKTVNSLSHYTDWTVGHVHSGTLGWNGFVAFAIIYYLIPKFWNTKLYSKSMANQHFWLGLVGILFYYISMTAAGITQGLMWQAIDTKGQLVYPDFIETVKTIQPLYWARALGGGMYIVGFVIMLINITKTIKLAPGGMQNEKIALPTASHSTSEPEAGHRKLEGMATIFVVLAFAAILVGTIIEIYPLLNIKSYAKPTKEVKVYTPLELEGRDLYIKEGCYLCHSQMIRQLEFDVLRYAPDNKIPSRLDESMYDHPFQWGSKRTGPDLARVGTKSYDAAWHYDHMRDPQKTSPGSIMPKYPWLHTNDLNLSLLPKKLDVMKNTLGVPYTAEDLATSIQDAEKQALTIGQELQSKVNAPAGIEKKQIVALIAYLKCLGNKGGY